MKEFKKWLHEHDTDITLGLMGLGTAISTLALGLEVYSLGKAIDQRNIDLIQRGIDTTCYKIVNSGEKGAKYIHKNNDGTKTAYRFYAKVIE